MRSFVWLKWNYGQSVNVAETHGCKQQQPDHSRQTLELYLRAGAKLRYLLAHLFVT